MSFGCNQSKSYKVKKASTKQSAVTWNFMTKHAWAGEFPGKILVTSKVSEWFLVVRMASGSVLLVGAGLTSSLTASLIAESLPGLSVPNLFCWSLEKSHIHSLTQGGSVGEGSGCRRPFCHFKGSVKPILHCWPRCSGRLLLWNLGWVKFGWKVDIECCSTSHPPLKRRVGRNTRLSSLQACSSLSTSARCECQKSCLFLASNISIRSSM